VTFIGHGDDVGHIKALQQRYPEKVTFLPPLPQVDIARHLRNADVFVTASEFETFGLVILESMACGVVPLVPRIAAYDELLAGGRAGFTYAPGDARDLLEAVHQMSTDRATLEERRRCALEESQRHGWNAVVDGLEEVAQ
jgi:glycosyltransferase involved in cell wall biosynthesis